MQTFLRVCLAFAIGLVAFSSLPPVNSTAQTLNGVPYGAETRFERLSVEGGLPNATVLSVLQDQAGFIWFATADGLARYDGLDFTIFRHDANQPNSLSHNNTFCLAQTRDGLIWIGTDPGGLNTYDPQTGQFQVYRHDPNDPTSLADDSVWALLEAQDGSLWVGTRNGLSRLNRKTGQFKNYLTDANNPRALAGAVVYRIYQDKAGTLWIGTRNALQRYDPASDDFTSYVNQPADPTSLSHNAVWSLLEDHEGNFWVGTRGGGLNLMDRKTGKFKAYRFDANDPTSLSGDRVWFVYEDSANNLWVTTETSGINLFNRTTGRFTRFQANVADPFSLSNNDIFWVTEDLSGVIWFASRYGGVDKLSPTLQRFGLYRSIPGSPNSLSSNSIYAMLAEKSGILWVGTFGGGLNKIDRRTGEVTVYKNDPNDPTSLSNDKIYYLYRDPQGVLWITTSGGGLNRMDPETGQFSAYRYSADNPKSLGSNFLTTLAAAGQGRLWVGTLGYGLDLFNPKTGEMEKEYFHDPANPNSLTEDTVYDLAVNQHGQVWIATARGGLELFDPATETFTHHLHDPQNDNSLLNDTVQTLYLDENGGMIWAGTPEGLSGLNLNTGQWQNYTVSDGLVNSTIMGILPGSQNDLWLSTGKGLSHLRLENETFTNYDARDGLQGDQFEIASAQRGPDGELFFGGSAGLTFFHPETITQNPYQPVTVLTDFQLFNQSVAVGSALLPQPIEKTSKISLNYDQSVFTLKFAALSYQISSKNRFQYKLEGFDKDWSPPRTTNQATYTNLSPGSYTFLVRAANHDDIWHTTPTRLTIEIRPPWWGTWWFRLGALLGVILLVIGGVQMRLSTIRASNRELEQRVDERTKELQEAQQQLQLANSELNTQLSEIMALESKVREQAIRDALTGLYNRHYLSEMLEAELSRARRGTYTVAFLLIDLDRFKEVNDTFGHPAGDQALKSVAKIISELTRRSDIACRFGGEEFMVILPEIAKADAQLRAEQLRQKIETIKLPAGEKTIRLTASIGVAMYPLHGETSDEMLSVVDTALYRAKETGRNRVILCGG